MNRHRAADVLIVGRGGGSLEDLWAFNDEKLARSIFASKIPVISAVGHEVDTTIADYAADQRAPTPSAAAEIVVRSCREIETHLDQLALRAGRALENRLSRCDARLTGLLARLRSPAQRLGDMQKRLDDQQLRLGRAWQHALERKQAALQLAAGRLKAYSPHQTLARGYAIVTREDGQSVVSRAADTGSGERLRIRFARGNARVSVDEVLP